MKKLLAWLIVLPLLAGLAACQQQAAPSTKSAPNSQSKEGKKPTAADDYTASL